MAFWEVPFLFFHLRWGEFAFHNWIRYTLIWLKQRIPWYDWNNLCDLSDRLSNWGFLRRSLWPARRLRQLRLPSSNSASRWNLIMENKPQVKPVIPLFNILLLERVSYNKTDGFVLIVHYVPCIKISCKHEDIIATKLVNYNQPKSPLSAYD